MTNKNTSRIGIQKRVSLAGYASGWDEQCYALIKPVSYPELRAIRNRDESLVTQEQIEERDINFVKEHLAGGRVMVYDDDGKLVLGDLNPDMITDDIRLVEFLSQALLSGATRYSDPKDSSEDQNSAAGRDLPSPLTETS